MKTKHYIFTIIFYINIIIILNAQAPYSFDAYSTEADAYFTHPKITEHGIIATDNFASKLYLFSSGTIKELAASPGCGRYYTLSPDRNHIGFKFIQPDGMQVPAYIEINSGKIIKLAQPVKQCGQVSFSNTGLMAYTIDNTLYITGNNFNPKFPLGNYANIAPIAPDGNYIAFCDTEGSLKIIDLGSGNIAQISINGEHCIYPVWSPDATKIVYKTTSGNLKIWDKVSGKHYIIGEGGSPDWSFNSNFIIFHKEKAENFTFLGSDIFIAKYDGSMISQLTQTANIHEMNPSFGDNETIVFHTNVATI
ncbi:MAG: hypothetical protein HY738_01005 [Bacteroidia bacterium]|nr:hypothetical protein [Bacteroidia bacterium]